jgi:hypothetical protein
METCDFHVPALPKPLNRLAWNLTRLRRRDTRWAKNSWNRLAGGGPTDRWNIIWKTFLLYLTLHFLFLYASTAWLTDLHARWFKRCGLLKGSAFWRSHWYEITFRNQNPLKTSHFSTRMPNFQPNQYTRITFYRWQTKNFNGSSIQNRGRRSELWRHFCFRTPPSGRNYFQSNFVCVKITNNA